MKAIVTKYLPATNNRGARIKAYDQDGNSIIKSREYDLEIELDSYKAAVALCTKMMWPGQLIGGSIKEGYAWVFLPKNLQP